MTRKFLGLLLLSSAMAWGQSEQPPQSPNQQPAQQRSERGFGRGRGNFQGTGGTITAISGDTLTLKTMNGGTATVKLTSSTMYRRDRQEAKLSDFKVGDMVMVRGEPSGENTWTAQGVMSNTNGMAMREQMGKKFIAGDVTKIEDTKLTLRRIDGETQVIEVDENTSFRNAKRESVTLADVKVGDRVFGRGDLKDGVFVPAVLNVGAPGEMMMRRGDGPRQGPPPAPGTQPQ
ncbi:MAG TPA: DUF5666 domain-containing protein [Bryobacteraceae bacterium]|nr:DUF5666 domain-containing protein [Bryobacteraceae bacterium]